MFCRLFGCRCPCLLRGRLCERIWSGKYTFLATYENREICRYFPRKSLRCKHASVGEWRMGRDGEGRDRTERDETGWKRTGQHGDGRDRNRIPTLSCPSPSRPVPLQSVSTLSRPFSCHPIPLHPVWSLSVLSRRSPTCPVPLHAVLFLSMPF